MDREQWRGLCEQELGKPYLWGADGPDAYDCSGFVQWALKPLGLDPAGDQTAAGLYRFFSDGRSSEVSVDESRLGDLVFFGSDESITHVALAWGNEEMLEAGGGGRKTITVAIARQVGAEVRIRRIARRPDLVGILRPNAIPWAADAAFAMVESPAGHGSYTNAPPLTEWLDDGRSMRLKRPFGFVEESGREWPVPSEIIVDGASIPRVFWSLIGGPFEGPYRNASVVHDYYCDVRTRTWQDTHRVFFEAMRCSGVNDVRAKVMYYAVYRFGPRWTMGPAAVAEAFDLTGALASVPTDLPVESFDAASFEADARRIGESELDIAAIEALADARAATAAGAIAESAGAPLPEDATAPSLDRLADAALAAFSRRPLLERLTALQDAAADPAAGEVAGALLSRYTAEVLVRRSTLAEEANLSFEDLEPRYAALYSSCRIRPERVGEVAWHRKKLVQYRPRYEAVSAKTGIPWWFIGVVHALEASFSFFAHLHNGDPLTGRTIQVPKNRPVTWNPPSDWESSAIDALTYEKLVGLADWSVSQALYRWESYNGFGYYSRQVNSPYLWSFSNHYTKGKFVADGKYDPHAVSKQCGAAVMLRALEDAGLVTTGSS
jgi:lysozyme family protein